MSQKTYAAVWKRHKHINKYVVEKFLPLDFIAIYTHVDSHVQ